jgi:hypothetical protein
MREQIEVGQMVFVVDGQVGVGAVREVHDDRSELVINIENGGDFVIPMRAVTDVHSGKVILDVGQLQAPVREALHHLHESEYRIYAALDPTDGEPEG